VLPLAPLVLIGPLLLLADVVWRLLQRGPLGWLAAAALLYAVWWATTRLLRAARRWWASTKAPVSDA